MTTFINEISYKCLLGPRAKNIIEKDNIYSWTVGKKQHFTTNKILNSQDILYLQTIAPSNFHYLSPENLDILNKNFDLDKKKMDSVSIELEKISLSGNENKSLRGSYNKCSKNTFEILDDYKKISDVEDLIEDWSTNYTDKYFRDFSGKNTFFYRNKFHENCINSFFYSGDRLVAFGTLAQDANDPTRASYVIGKALYKSFYGLSEYADLSLYDKAKKNGIKVVNLGQAINGLNFYKNKFAGAFEHLHYDGSIE